MGRRFVPAVIVSAILALAVAAASMAFSLDEPRLWSASIALIMLSGLTPMIYAVNIRIVPVFSRRSWPRFRLLMAGVVSGIAGGWLVYFGRAVSGESVETAGHAAALAGGLVFVGSVISLFRSPATTNVAPPLPHPEQALIDRVGTHFMRMASGYLLLGLLIGLVSSMWTPGWGRWDLVWAHVMLLGWFLSMASGVEYHVLSRWTGERWRSPRRIQAHLVLVLVALPAMLVALASDVSWLFAVAGTLQAAALLLFIWNIGPLAFRLPAITRDGLMIAAAFLAVGVLLGASVAVDPGNHVRLRFTHAQINLLGWGGLLVSSMGYYLFPRFAGRPLQWPRLARMQLYLHAAGVLTGAVAWWWYLAVGTGASSFITAGGLMVSGSFLLFCGIVAATFQRSASAATSEVKLLPRRPTPVR
jgi:hypothetical protein